jgi:hypothetical protein
VAAATPAHYLSLALGFGLLFYLDRRLWFIYDIFEFFARMQPGHSFSLLVPHNEHWSTIPILLILVVYRLVGLHSYIPYLALDLLAHVAVAHLLWRWMRRLGSDPWVATALATVFLVVGGGVDDITSAFQVGFVLPVALGLLGIYLIDYEGASRWPRDAGYWPVAVAATMCSGMGVCMVAVGAAVALLRRGWRAAARVAAPPAAVYVVWLILVGEAHISTIPAPKWELPQIVQYVWTGLTSAIENTTGWAGAGGLLAIGLAIWLYLNRRQARGRAALAFAAPLISLPFFAVIGVGRIALGVSEGSATRYGYIWIALLLPATALALTQLARRSLTGRWVALGLSAVVAVNGVAAIASWEAVNAPIAVAERGEILAAAHLLANGAQLAVGSDAQVEPVRSPDVTVSVLRFMLAAGKLPMTDSVTETDILNASLYLQVSVTPAPLVTGSGPPPAVGNDVRPLPLPASAGCVSVANGASSSQLRLLFSSTGSVAITPEGTGDIEVQLAYASAPLALTTTNSFPVAAGQTVHLNVTRPGTAPLLTLPAGLTTVCGVGDS